jgi:hypothetical protein
LSHGYEKHSAESLTVLSPATGFHNVQYLIRLSSSQVPQNEIRRFQPNFASALVDELFLIPKDFLPQVSNEDANGQDDRREKLVLPSPVQKEDGSNPENGPDKD